MFLPKRQPSIARGLSQKKVFSADKLAQAKIDQMFRKTREQVGFYLDPVVIEKLELQLQQARGAGPF